MSFSYHNEVVPAGLWKTSERKGKSCFPWSPGTTSSLGLWESQRRRPSISSRMKWIRCHALLISILITQLVESGHVNAVFDRLSVFPFHQCCCSTSAVKLVHRHLHSLTDVDVGKDNDTCGHASAFAHDLRPHGEYHTHTHADISTHKGTERVKTWPFSICNFPAVGVNVAHTWCVIHSAYGRRGWRELSSR